MTTIKNTDRDPSLSHSLSPGIEPAPLPDHERHLRARDMFTRKQRSGVGNSYGFDASSSLNRNAQRYGDIPDLAEIANYKLTYNTGGFERLVSFSEQRGDRVTTTVLFANGSRLVVEFNREQGTDFSLRSNTALFYDQSGREHRVQVDNFRDGELVYETQFHFQFSDDGPDFNLNFEKQSPGDLNFEAIVHSNQQPTETFPTGEDLTRFNLRTEPYEAPTVLNVTMYGGSGDSVYAPAGKVRNYRIVLSDGSLLEVDLDSYHHSNPKTTITGLRFYSPLATTSRATNLMVDNTQLSELRGRPGSRHTVVINGKVRGHSNNLQIALTIQQPRQGGGRAEIVGAEVVSAPNHTRWEDQIEAAVASPIPPVGLSESESLLANTSLLPDPVTARRMAENPYSSAQITLRFFGSLGGVDISQDNSIEIPGRFIRGEFVPQDARVRLMDVNGTLVSYALVRNRERDWELQAVVGVGGTEFAIPQQRYANFFGFGPAGFANQMGAALLDVSDTQIFQHNVSLDDADWQAASQETSQEVRRFLNVPHEAGVFVLANDPTRVRVNFETQTLYFVREISDGVIQYRLFIPSQTPMVRVATLPTEAGDSLYGLLYADADEGAAPEVVIPWYAGLRASANNSRQFAHVHLPFEIDTSDGLVVRFTENLVQNERRAILDSQSVDEFYENFRELSNNRIIGFRLDDGRQLEIAFPESFDTSLSPYEILRSPPSVLQGFVNRDFHLSVTLRDSQGQILHTGEITPAANADAWRMALPGAPTGFLRFSELHFVERANGQHGLRFVIPNVAVQNVTPPQEDPAPPTAAPQAEPAPTPEGEPEPVVTALQPVEDDPARRSATPLGIADLLQSLGLGSPISLGSTGPTENYTAFPWVEGVALLPTQETINLMTAATTPTEGLRANYVFVGRLPNSNHRVEVSLPFLFEDGVWQVDLGVRGEFTARVLRGRSRSPEVLAEFSLALQPGEDTDGRVTLNLGNGHVLTYFQAPIVQGNRADVSRVAGLVMGSVTEEALDQLREVEPERVSVDSAQTVGRLLLPHYNEDGSESSVWVDFYSPLFQTHSGSFVFAGEPGLMANPVPDATGVVSRYSRLRFTDVTTGLSGSFVFQHDEYHAFLVAAEVNGQSLDLSDIEQSDDRLTLQTSMPSLAGQILGTASQQNLTLGWMATEDSSAVSVEFLQLAGRLVLEGVLQELDPQVLDESEIRQARTPSSVAPRQINPAASSANPARVVRADATETTEPDWGQPVGYLRSLGEAPVDFATLFDVTAASSFPTGPVWVTYDLGVNDPDLGLIAVLVMFDPETQRYEPVLSGDRYAQMMVAAPVEGSASWDTASFTRSAVVCRYRAATDDWSLEIPGSNSRAIFTNISMADADNDDHVVHARPAPQLWITHHRTNSGRATIARQYLNALSARPYAQEITTPENFVFEIVDGQNVYRIPFRLETDPRLRRPLALPTGAAEHERLGTLMGRAPVRYFLAGSQLAPVVMLPNGMAFEVHVDRSRANPYVSLQPVHPGTVAVMTDARRRASVLLTHQGPSAHLFLDLRAGQSLQDQWDEVVTDPDSPREDGLVVLNRAFRDLFTGEELEFAFEVVGTESNPRLGILGIALFNTQADAEGVRHQQILQGQFAVDAQAGLIYVYVNDHQYLSFSNHVGDTGMEIRSHGSQLEAATYERLQDRWQTLAPSEDVFSGEAVERLPDEESREYVDPWTDEETRRIVRQEISERYGIDPRLLERMLEPPTQSEDSEYSSYYSGAWVGTSTRDHRIYNAPYAEYYFPVSSYTDPSVEAVWEMGLFTTTDQTAREGYKPYVRFRGEEIQNFEVISRYGHRFLILLDPRFYGVVFTFSNGWGDYHFDIETREWMEYVLDGQQQRQRIQRQVSREHEVTDENVVAARREAVARAVMSYFVDYNVLPERGTEPEGAYWLAMVGLVIPNFEEFTYANSMTLPFTLRFLLDQDVTAFQPLVRTLFLRLQQGRLVAADCQRLVGLVNIYRQILDNVDQQVLLDPAGHLLATSRRNVTQELLRLLEEDVDRNVPDIRDEVLQSEIAGEDLFDWIGQFYISDRGAFQTMGRVSRANPASYDGFFALGTDYLNQLARVLAPNRGLNTPQAWIDAVQAYLNEPRFAAYDVALAVTEFENQIEAWRQRGSLSIFMEVAMWVEFGFNVHCRVQDQQVNVAQASTLRVTLMAGELDQQFQARGVITGSRFFLRGDEHIRAIRSTLQESMLVINQRIEIIEQQRREEEERLRSAEEARRLEEEARRQAELASLRDAERARRDQMLSASPGLFDQNLADALAGIDGVPDYYFTSLVGHEPGILPVYAAPHLNTETGVYRAQVFDDETGRPDLSFDFSTQQLPTGYVQYAIHEVASQENPRALDVLISDNGLIWVGNTGADQGHVYQVLVSGNTGALLGLAYQNHVTDRPEDSMRTLRFNDAGAMLGDDGEIVDLEEMDWIPTTDAYAGQSLWHTTIPNLGMVNREDVPVIIDLRGVEPNLNSDEPIRMLVVRDDMQELEPEMVERARNVGMGVIRVIGLNHAGWSMQTLSFWLIAQRQVLAESVPHSRPEQFEFVSDAAFQIIREIANEEGQGHEVQTIIDQGYGQFAYLYHTLKGIRYNRNVVLSVLERTEPDVLNFLSQDGEFFDRNAIGQRNQNLDLGNLVFEIANNNPDPWFMDRLNQMALDPLIPADQILYLCLLYLAEGSEQAQEAFDQDARRQNFMRQLHHYQLMAVDSDYLTQQAVMGEDWRAGQLQEFEIARAREMETRQVEAARLTRQAYRPVVRVPAAH